MPRLRRLPTPGSLVAVLLLVSGVGLAPSTSKAGCGHYVTSKMDADGALGIGFEGSEAGIDTAQDAASPERPTSACTGPHCSRGRPFHVPAPRAEPRMTQWACLHFPEFLPGPPTSLLPSRDDGPPPSGRADRLDRPPR